MATIEKRGNSYRITVSHGYDIAGRQIRHKMTWTPKPGMTDRQAEKELNRQAVLFEERCTSQLVQGGNVRLADYLETWFRDYAEQQLKPTTIATYRTFLPRVNAALGHIRLEKLQPRDFVAFYSTLDKEDVRLDTTYTSSLDFKQLLADRGLTQATFCKQFSIGHGIVESLCAGQNISRTSAEKVATALALPVDAFLEPVRRGTLSGKTKLHYHRFLSSALETAVQWQMIASNPCRRVKAPRAARKETDYLDEQQAAQLIAALDQEPIQYRAMILLLLNTGLRRGELCGLSWPDINFETAVLSVHRNAVYVSGKGVSLVTPKTTSSQRSIKLPMSVIPMLQEYRAWQDDYKTQLGDVWVGTDLVFPSCDGSPMRPDTLTNWFAGFIRRHDLPHVTIHGLRHTNATLLIAAGTNLRTVSGRLGHAQASTTANIYAHAVRSADAAAAETIESILAAKPK